jgi:hypothetical protein
VKIEVDDNAGCVLVIAICAITFLVLAIFG